MLHCTLSTLMGKKRVTIQEVHNQTGLSRNTIANLYYDRATRIDYETVGKLCDYFSCNINDLFDYTTKENAK
ncbi:Cro/Cl family transcriptional regulator [Clostridium sp. Bc-iso-3]|nr:Cro/Cl family transcriptional regulator [Clostridium sp. Bc-iso-3]